MTDNELAKAMMQKGMHRQLADGIQKLSGLDSEVFYAMLDDDLYHYSQETYFLDSFSNNDAISLIEYAFEKGLYNIVSNRIRWYRNLNFNIAKTLIDKGHGDDVIGTVTSFSEQAIEEIEDYLIDQKKFSMLYYRGNGNLNYTKIANAMLLDDAADHLAWSLEYFHNLSPDIATKLNSLGYEKEVLSKINAFIGLNISFV